MGPAGPLENMLERVINKAEKRIASLGKLMPSSNKRRLLYAMQPPYGLVSYSLKCTHVNYQYAIESGHDV